MKNHSNYYQMKS